MSTSRIIDGFKATVGARLFNTVANGLLIFLLAGVLLSPDEYGLLFLVISIVSIAQIGSDLGLARSAARYVSDRKETDPGSVRFVLRTSIRYRLLLLGLVAGALVVGRDVIALVLETPELTVLLLVGALYLCAISLYSYHQTLFQGFNRVELSARIEVINSLGRVVFVVAFTALGLGVAGALFGYVLGAGIAAVTGAVLLYRRFYTAYPESGGSRSLRNRLLEYSVPLTASQSANVLDRQFDTVLVGYFLTPVAVSYYVLGKQISEFVTVVSGSLGFSISPSFGEQKATESLERAARLYETSLQYVLLLYLPAAVGLFLVADPAISLVFGVEYAGAAPVLQVLGIYVVFQSITDITTNSLDYLGRAKARAIAKGVTSVANVVLNVVLIPIYGVVGAAIATVVTFGIYTLVNVYVMHLELSLDVWRLGRAVGIAGGIAGAMGVAVLSLVPYVSTLPTLVGVVVVGIGVWAGLAVVSGLVDPREAVAQLT
ncbi:flippase [Natronobacterium gregoryi]|uniref:Flippase n=2 Tax=Natronobacterium gregoryi TaxID=44930 RepID=L0AKF7_NATGS|nr:flippase [Natronobacterium gregoryi]AFZ74383.1 membrane protein involved in the export of O-antigen and teichoic acid [Natronobacterium gregoryi SP2]ELY74106.1 polysaccharide biosynthesis protein [Natronobacterium gregoryi SP2]PLK22106.1 flippase [Natronobacterium gregoryi SP2]SFJ61358.1 Membrane protein involved in the export of O-antigen and teichoic acid [Natronobacterium gregoryi]